MEKLNDKIFQIFTELLPSCAAYRYSFQGQEKDDEVVGASNSINYTYRMHDVRVGRFFAVDPLDRKYPYNSPYAFSENKVIHAIELEGMEAWEKRRDWQPSDIENFNRYAKTKLYIYKMQGIQDDCADLWVRLLVDYAYREGLVVTLHEAVEKTDEVPEKPTDTFTSSDEKFTTKDEFLEEAQGSTDATSIANWDTYLISSDEKISGDIKFVYTMDRRVGHTVIIFTNGKIAAKYKVDPDKMVIYGNPNKPITIGKDIFTQGSWNNPDAVSRYNMLDFGEQIHMEPGDELTPEEIHGDLELIPEDE